MTTRTKTTTATRATKAPMTKVGEKTAPAPRARARATVAPPAPETMKPLEMAERLRIQADLGAMEARDQWERLATELEHRRRTADAAVRTLLDGGIEASRSVADGVREAVEQLRDSVESAMKLLR